MVFDFEENTPLTPPELLLYSILRVYGGFSVNVIKKESRPFIQRTANLMSKIYGSEFVIDPADIIHYFTLANWQQRESPTQIGKKQGKARYQFFSDKVTSSLKVNADLFVVVNDDTAVLTTERINYAANANLMEP